ncbi:J domain-containing protein, partial [Xanthomonas oryzae pv. oryzae]
MLRRRPQNLLETVPRRLCGARQPARAGV